ncbi:hypothetical protein [Vibrio alfacsensis]|uniref:hypothetical protein n=1 Tax=Vibrio alfacsensis TaxID=1074311 RepID=UPI001C806A80|nr:hypothetical protein [Vibrio alfacsensis]
MEQLLDESLRATALLTLPFLSAFLIFNLCRITLASRITASKLAKNSYSIIGLIGIPLHELSHAAFALLFGHKIKSVKWYSISGDAYVHHSYNKNSKYQRLGNLFIAIAPFFTAMFIANYLLKGHIPDFISLDSNQQSLIQSVLSTIEVVPTLIGKLVLESAWYESLLLVTVSFYCIPSNADFRNAFDGLIFALPAILSVVPACILAFPSITMFLSTSLILGGMCVVFSLIGWAFFFLLSFIPISNQ